MNPRNMTVLLTGASGGIGRELAIKLAEQGASLHLTGRDEAELSQLGQRLRNTARAGQEIHTYTVNLLDDSELMSFCSQISVLTTPINVVVNNAGLSRFDWLENHSDRDIERIMQLNAVVPMKLTRALLPVLKVQAEARIVNVASTFGALGFPGYSVYSASKHAMRGFSESLARELADTSVSVGCFVPRATQTDINTSAVVEMNQVLKVSMDKPADVAEALVKFIASRSQQQALGWPEKMLVRVNGLMPELISHALKKQLPTIRQFALRTPPKQSRNVTPANELQTNSRA